MPSSSQPVHSQIPIQPNLNPNNKGVHKIDTLNLPSYRISTTELYEMNLRSGRTFDAQAPPIIIEQLDSEGREVELVNGEPKQTNRTQMPPVKQHHSEPPYPKRLIMSKPGPQSEFDLLGEFITYLLKFPCYKICRMCQSMQKVLGNIVQRNLPRKLKIPSLYMLWESCWIL